MTITSAALILIAAAAVDPFTSVLAQNDHQHQWVSLSESDAGSIAFDSAWQRVTDIDAVAYPTTLIRTTIVSDTHATFYMDAVFAVDCNTAMLAMTDAWMGTPGTDQQVRPTIEDIEFVEDPGMGLTSAMTIVDHVCAAEATP